MAAALPAKNNNPHFGRGVAHIDDSTPDINLEEAALRDWLDGFLQKPTVELPRLPTVATEILALTRRSNAKIEDLAALLERDPFMAGKVLKLSNSALYGAAQPCASLKQAMIRIGVSLVRDVVMEVAFSMTVIHAPGLSDTLEEVRRHSSAVAYLSRLIARQTAIDAENCFLVGLLHDVGLSIGLLGLSEFLKKEKKAVALTPMRWLAIERQHELFTGKVLESWRLGPQVELVARHHHQLVISGHPHPGVAILLVASALADAAGWSIRPNVARAEDDMAFTEAHEKVSPDEVDRALQVLRLTPKQYEGLQAEAAKVLSNLDATFKAGPK